MRLSIAFAVYAALVLLVCPIYVTAQTNLSKDAPAAKQPKTFTEIKPIPEAQRQHKHSRPTLPAYERRSRDYLPLWQCVCATSKPRDAKSMKVGKPSTALLAEALLESVDAGDVVCVRSLLNGGADIEAAASNPARLQGPPLRLALMQKEWEVASYLVDRGAKLTWRENGQTPLQLAELFGAPDKLISKITMRTRTSRKR